MSRDMRSSARNPANAAATTIVKSVIGRRSANDTKFIVPPQPATAPGRPMPTKLWRRAEEMRLKHPSICSAPEIQRPQALSRTWTANRLGMAGSLLAPTTKDIFRPGRRASGQTVADWRVSGLASPHQHEECEGGRTTPLDAGKIAKM